MTTDRIRERLKNQGVEFTRMVAEEMLKRANVTLSPDWSRRQRTPVTGSCDCCGLPLSQHLP